MLVLFEGEYGIRDTVRFLEDKLRAGIWTWNVDSSDMNWSPGMFRLLGLDAKSVKPSIELLRQMILTADRPHAGEAERLIKRGLNFDRSYRIARPDGRIRTVQNRGEALKADGNTNLAVGVISDITDLAAATELKLEMEERFRALIAALGGLVWVIRPDGWITERQGGFAGDQAGALGDSWQQLVHPDDVEPIKASIARAARKNTGYTIEHRRRSPDGTYRWARASASPVRDPNGEIREFVGVTTDIQNERVLPETSAKDDEIITGAQIRAARGLVKWSVQDLSDASGVSSAVIRRCEATDAFCHTSRHAELAIRDTLSRAGAKFYFHPGAKPCVGPR